MVLVLVVVGCGMFLGTVLVNLGDAWVLGICLLGLCDHLGGTWSLVSCMVLGFRQASGYTSPFLCFLVIHVPANFFFLSVHHEHLYLSSGHPASGCPLVLGVFMFFNELSAACIKGFLNPCKFSLQSNFLSSLGGVCRLL